MAKDPNYANFSIHPPFRMQEGEWEDDKKWLKKDEWIKMVEEKGLKKEDWSSMTAEKGLKKNY